MPAPATTHSDVIGNTPKLLEDASAAELRESPTAAAARARWGHYRHV